MKFVQLIQVVEIRPCVALHAVELLYPGFEAESLEMETKSKGGGISILGSILRLHLTAPVHADSSF